MTTLTTILDPATEKQVAFGVALCNQIAELMPAPTSKQRAAQAQSYMSGLSKVKASEYITLLIAMRDELKKAQAEAYEKALLENTKGTFKVEGPPMQMMKKAMTTPVTPTVLPDKGYYLVTKDLGKGKDHPGYTEVVTVTHVFKGSDMLTAKRLWMGHNHKAKWVRDKSLRTLMGKHPEKVQPLTMDQAAQLGHLHGVCVICGRALTDPKSVLAGIGPVCIKNQGW